MVSQLYRLCALFFPIALEGLPVSSSGHVVLCAIIMERMAGSVTSSLPETIDHILHLPIAIIVGLFFFPRWWYLLKHINRLWAPFFKILLLGLITVSTTAAIYFLFKIRGTDWFPLWLGYAITATLLFSLRYFHKSTAQAPLLNGQWNIYTAPILGAAQGLALLPGISRLGITYTTAVWLGMRPQKAFELSFLIEFPISIAGFLKGLHDVQDFHIVQMMSFVDIAIIIMAMIIGYSGLCVMQYLVKTNTVWLLGWYALCVSVIAYVL